MLQRQLSTLYVQYDLLAHLEDGKNRAVVISELHAQIQDAFNEHGAQIMSSHIRVSAEKAGLGAEICSVCSARIVAGFRYDRRSRWKSKPSEIETRENSERSATGQAQLAFSGRKKRT